MSIHILRHGQCFKHNTIVPSKIFMEDFSGARRVHEYISRRIFKFSKLQLSAFFNVWETFLNLRNLYALDWCVFFKKRDITAYSKKGAKSSSFYLHFYNFKNKIELPTLFFLKSFVRIYKNVKSNNQYRWLIKIEDLFTKLQRSKIPIRLPRSKVSKPILLPRPK